MLLSTASPPLVGRGIDTFCGWQAAPPRCHPAKFSSTIFDKDTVLTRKFVRDPVGALLVKHVFLKIILK